MAILVNIIGAGNLGKTIGHLLVKNQLVQIGAICNASEKSSKQAIKFIGEGEYCSAINYLPPADITFITTPDDLIVKTCEKLSKTSSITPGNIVLHCSGSLTTDALMAMSARGCHVASIHPMRSFAKPELSIELYEGTFCAMEGDSEALTVLKPLFDAIGSITYEIKKGKKSLYHAAGVFASNYLVTLSQQALDCLQEAGVENQIAMKLILNIMQGTLSNLESTLSPADSLTGPLKRGDIATLNQHLASLSSGQKALYTSLAKATLPLITHDDDKKALINSLLIKSPLPLVGEG